MGNGKCGQMGIMVNTEDRDGAPWGMGHMGDGAMGHMVNVVMCLIMCNFLNTAWIFTKILLHIDIDVFYLNILIFPQWPSLSKKLIDFSYNMFAHCMIGSKTWYKTCAWLVFGQLLSNYSIKSLDILTVIRPN